jgi:antitoxin CptB
LFGRRGDLYRLPFTLQSGGRRSDVTGTTRSSDGLDPRRRKALFRAWRRGTREADLLLGRFADAYIADLGEADLAAFEALLEVRDQDLLGWVTGSLAMPPIHATPLFAAILAFHSMTSLSETHEQD